jgi:hypothetical protein
MTQWIDSKGKVFTNVVHKQERAVLIQTVTGLIQGHIYVHSDQRLIDEMNAGDRFLAVTNASVLDADGGVVHRADFLTLNKAHVVWIRPDDEGPSTAEE